MECEASVNIEFWIDLVLRAQALVEVKGAYIELFEDENGELITYEVEGETFYAAEVVYDLASQSWNIVVRR